MRWTVLNALGGLAWLAGVDCARGTGGPAGGFVSSEHHVFVGATIGAMGLIVLLWANLRNAS